MKGRESVALNDLFFVCSLIEYIGRKTKNERKLIVNALGRDGLLHYYKLADVYHCENIDKVTDEIVCKYGITVGTYDNVAQAQGHVPTYWDIGKVMYRLVYGEARRSHKSVIDTLIKVYNSWIVPKIDNYNSSMYYENTSYQLASYRAKRAL
ncbi:MAG: hypothetical protein ACOYJE_08865 [Bacteroidaceae bacterium]|jgi:hypothetical protein